ncbi:hypothetical protein ABK040_010627 [Willaertia magna]
MSNLQIEDSGKLYIFPKQKEEAENLMIKIKNELNNKNINQFDLELIQSSSRAKIVLFNENKNIKANEIKNILENSNFKNELQLIEIVGSFSLH